MLGAIIGDVIGSPYEFESDKTKDFMLFVPDCRPTDDSVLTVAVGCACAEANCYDEYEFKHVLAEKLREIGLQYRDAGYGKRFYQWMILNEDEPYSISSTWRLFAKQIESFKDLCNKPISATVHDFAVGSDYE